MKKLLNILLMTLMMLFLAACGGDEDGAEDATPEVEEETGEEVTAEESAAGGAADEENDEAAASEENDEASTDEAKEDATESADPEDAEASEDEGMAGGAFTSGPYEQEMVRNPAGEECIMSGLAAEECDDVTMQEKFLAYHHLTSTNALPVSPNIGCLECMVDYSFAVMEGDQMHIEIPKMDEKGAPFTPDLETFMTSYAYELANFFNGHPNRLMGYINQNSPAAYALGHNRTSGDYSDHTTHDVDVENIVDLGDGVYRVTMYREYEHATSNGIGGGTVDYTVEETPHAFEIMNFKAVGR